MKENISGTLLKLLLYSFISTTIIGAIISVIFIIISKSIFLLLFSKFVGIIFSIGYLIIYLLLPYKFSTLILKNGKYYLDQKELDLSKIKYIIQKKEIFGKIEIPTLIIEFENNAGSNNIHLLERINLFFMFSNRYNLLTNRFYSLSEKFLSMGLPPEKLLTELEFKKQDLK